MNADNLIEISPGDMVYYESSLATAVLIKREGDLWVYLLRSPTQKNRKGKHLISIRSDPESLFIEGVLSGRFKYYSTG